MAWPHQGEQAPSITLPDTAGIMHSVPSEYVGRVVQLFFWQSG